jgi:hypothetical protein
MVAALAGTQLAASHTHLADLHAGAAVAPECSLCVQGAHSDLALTDAGRAVIGRCIATFVSVRTAVDAPQASVRYSAPPRAPPASTSSSLVI